MSLHGDRNSGAAKRRRDRRLRMHWRHEQLTLQMVLATVQHHSYGTLRGQSTATRTVEWGREQNYTAVTRDPPTPQPELFSLFEEKPGGVRPGSVTDLVPQARVLRHVVAHTVEACPFVKILDAPVPQGGNQLLEAFRHLDLHIPEQVIEVPKISSSRRRCRRRRVPVVQTAEQLVEVPEFVSFAFLFQQQIADAPGRLQGLLPGQDYSLVWEQIVDTPVFHGRGRAHRGGLQGARPGQNSAAFYGTEHVEIPVPQGRGGRGGLLGAGPDTNSAASSVRSGAADEVFPGVFALFPGGKKVRRWVRTRGRN